MMGGCVDDGEQNGGGGRGEDIKMLDDEGSSLEVGLDRGWRGDRFLAVGQQAQGDTDGATPVASDPTTRVFLITTSIIAAE